MPRTKLNKAVSQDLPRMKMSEAGYTGLRIDANRVTEDLKRELLWPNCIRVYKQMQYDPTIASALQLYDIMFAASVWKVKAPENATPEQKERTKFINQCMHDMKHSWRDFIQEAGSMVPYGFSVHEKVFRRRLKSSGSKYDDGLVGWSKLAPRGQDSISEWLWTDDGRDLAGLVQDVSLTQNYKRYRTIKEGTEIILPRKKFLLFRTGKKKDNPEGDSVLKGVYTPWKLRCAIEETEAIGIQRDLSGLPVVYIPPQYMASDASPEQKDIYEYYKKMVMNIQANQQAGIVMPMAYDPESKQPLFEFKLMGSEGRKNFDTASIIHRYDNKILTTLGADILIMGQSSTGSYNLATVKQSLINLQMEAKFQEIADVINNDLIPHTFELNGWQDTEYPEVYFDALGETDLEQLSKYLQRTASVGLIERDREILNKVRVAMGVQALDEDLPPQEELLTGNTSKASAAMDTPFEGGRRSQGDGNDNDFNNDNTA